MKGYIILMTFDRLYLYWRSLWRQKTTRLKGPPHCNSGLQYNIIFEQDILDRGLHTPNHILSAPNITYVDLRWDIFIKVNNLHILTFTSQSKSNCGNVLLWSKTHMNYSSYMIRFGRYEKKRKNDPQHILV